MMKDIEQHIFGEDMTIDSICDYLQHKDEI